MRNGWTGGQYSLFRVTFGLYLAIHFTHLIPWGAELFSNAGALSESTLSPLARLFPNYLVLFDTPPILPVTDAVTISSKVDGTIMVYQVGRIGRKALRRAKFLLDHAKANVLGVVLTNVSAEIAPEYSYLDYQYR